MENTVEWITYAETIAGNERLCEWLIKKGETVTEGVEVQGVSSGTGKPITGYFFNKHLLSELRSFAAEKPNLKIKILRRRSRHEKWKECDWLFRPVKAAVAKQVAKALAEVKSKTTR